MATAKALGGGLPLGAFLLSEALADIFDPGEHGTTYGGNPLACAAGLAVVETVSKESFLERVRQNGDYFKTLLKGLSDEYKDIISDVRGEGLMLGVEVGQYAVPIFKEAFKQGLLFNIAGGNTLRFIPPLIVNRAHIDEAMDKLSMTFKSLF